LNSWAEAGVNTCEDLAFFVKNAPASQGETMIASVMAAALLAAATPSQIVKDGNAEVQKILEMPDASVEKLAAKVDDFVDFAELAKRALGKEWDKLSRKQQQEFSSTMKGLLRASYAQKAIGQGKADVNYGEEHIKANEATVESTIGVKKDKFPVLYKLYRTDGRSTWRIYDVVTDDVSLVETYREQFRKLIATKGFEGLLVTLRTKRDQLEKNSHAPINAAKSTDTPIN
jgi:phospholipid transport system substrate-binding protein